MYILDQSSPGPVVFTGTLWTGWSRSVWPPGTLWTGGIQSFRPPTHPVV